MKKYFEHLEFNKASGLDMKYAYLLKGLITSVRVAASIEEVHDFELHYLLHYTNFNEAMLTWEQKCSKERLASYENNTSTPGEEISEENDENTKNTSLSLEVHLDPNSAQYPITQTVDRLTGRKIRQRHIRTTAAYEVANRAGITSLVQHFGMSAANFADNVHNQYLRHDVDQCPMLPADAAAEFICPQFPTPESALTAARYMLAFEISREPVVRNVARSMLLPLALMDMSPTSRGSKIIDESHILYGVKYLRGKHVADLMGDPLFLHIHNAKRDRLITYTIRIPDSDIPALSLATTLQPFFHQDEFSALVQAWNEQRLMVLEEAIKTFFKPQFSKEVHSSLLESSQQAVLGLCSRKLFDCLRMAPLRLDENSLDETGSLAGGRSRPIATLDKQQSSVSVWSKSARVLAVALKEEGEQRYLVVTVQLDSNGEIVDFLHLPGLLHFGGRFQKADAKAQKDHAVRRLTSFILQNRPQVIVIGCDCRRALDLRNDIQEIVEKLATESRLSNVTVELMNTELSIVFARSRRASKDLPSSYSTLLKQAISLGRRFQEPLAEFSLLFNSEDEILGLRWHPLQDSVPRDLLLRALEIEFVNRVNELGVDVNRCLSHTHMSGLVQFICGLGPRKGSYMLKVLRQKKMQLTIRRQLVTDIGFGPRVVINCAGFIKIDVASIRDYDVDVELLDSTRVHPESYDLAKKMAVDALEYDDADDNDPTAALEEIIQSPTRLRELDLDAFAEELKREGHGDKHATLYDIRKELNKRYRDIRDLYEKASLEAIFSMVTHETPDTLSVGRLIDCQVVSVVMKKPNPDQLDSANPTKNEETGNWICPFCKQDDFLQLSQIWVHFDSNECPGRPVGFRTRLENDLIGFIPLRHVELPTEQALEQLHSGAIVQARVMKIDLKRFNVELSMRSTDIKDERNMWRPHKDPFFDYSAEESDILALELENKRAKAEASQVYINRVIFHPYFRNITYDQLLAIEPQMDIGGVVIRPSRKGTDHLTVSLKIDNGILKHFEVKESDKTHSFVLGSSLSIGDNKFDDLDEIVARFIQPMVYLIREVMVHKCYRDTQGGNREKLIDLLRADKITYPNKIPYFISSVAQYPGFYVIAYQPKATPHFELFSVLPDGFKFRRAMFPSLDRLIGWFKDHYNEKTGRNITRDYTTRSPMAPQTPQICIPKSPYNLPVAYAVP